MAISKVTTPVNCSVTTARVMALISRSNMEGLAHGICLTCGASQACVDEGLEHGLCRSCGSNGVYESTVIIMKDLAYKSESIVADPSQVAWKAKHDARAKRVADKEAKRLADIATKEAKRIASVKIVDVPATTKPSPIKLKTMKDFNAAIASLEANFKPFVAPAFA